MVINDSSLNNCPKLDFSSPKCQMMIIMRILVLVIEKSITKIDLDSKNQFRAVLVGQSLSQGLFPGSFPGTADRDQHLSVMTEDCRSRASRDRQLPGHHREFSVTRRSRPHVLGNMGRYREHYPGIPDRDQGGSVTPGQHRSRPDRYREPPSPTRSPATNHLRPPAATAGHRRSPPLTTGHHR